MPRFRNSPARSLPDPQSELHTVYQGRPWARFCSSMIDRTLLNGCAAQGRRTDVGLPAGLEVMIIAVIFAAVRPLDAVQTASGGLVTASCTRDETEYPIDSERGLLKQAALFAIADTGIY